MGAIQCTICPNRCWLKAGQVGICRARKNVKGEIVSTTYGRPCAVRIDPVEKKPLYHFLPGSKTFSIGMPGCNLNCKHCQNAEISQHGPQGLPAYELPPRAVAAAAVEGDCPSVSYTYTEPLVALEYVCDCAQACRAAGLRNIMVTAAYATPETVQAVAKVMDAANVDIKGMSDAFYRDVCGVDALKFVLDALVQWREAGMWLEITYLVIPTLNDTEAEFKKLAAWIKTNLGAETPLHLSQFYPTHRLSSLSATPEATLLAAYACAREEGLHHVYIGNTETAGGSDTLCVGCGAPLVRRQRFSVLENRVQDGKCQACGRVAAGVWRRRVQ